MKKLHILLLCLLPVLFFLYVLLGMTQHAVPDLIVEADQITSFSVSHFNIWTDETYRTDMTDHEDIKEMKQILGQVSYNKFLTQKNDRNGAQVFNITVHYTGEDEEIYVVVIGEDEVLIGPSLERLYRGTWHNVSGFWDSLDSPNQVNPSV